MALARRTQARRRIPMLVAAAVSTVMALMVSACSDGHIDVRSVAGAGWSSFGGNGANSNFAYPTVPDDLALSWTRPAQGRITSPVTISATGNVGVTSRATGCDLLVLDQRNGRLNFCKNMRDGISSNAMLTDQYDQPYVGEEGMFLAFNAGGAIRWRMPTIGVPLSAKFAASGVVLMTTSQGQILLLNSQTSAFSAPEVRLNPTHDGSDPLAGFSDCLSNGPQCTIPAAPAVDEAHQRFFLNVWPNGASASEIRGFDYAEKDGARTIRQLWKAQIPGGVIGPATLSADGNTVYTFSRRGQIVALDASTGKTRWTYDNGGYGFATMSVSPDGLIMPTGLPGSPLTLIRDAGDRAEKVWQRDDLAATSLSTLTNAGTAWTVVRDAGKQTLSLTEVSTTDGKTLRSVALPDSSGFTTGIAVSSSGQIATATNAGQVYFFDSKSRIQG